MVQEADFEKALEKRPEKTTQKTTQPAHARGGLARNASHDKHEPDSAIDEKTPEKQGVATKCHRGAILKRCQKITRLGFEPRLTGPKPVVLPLHHRVFTGVSNASPVLDTRTDHPAPCLHGIERHARC